MGYKVESDFHYKGLRCVVIITDMCHRCGYVGVENNHPLYGVNYFDEADFLKGSPEWYFDVHGGITYSGGDNYPVESNLWWFGFDCAHYGDGKDYKSVSEYQIIDKDRLKYYMECDKRFPDIRGVVRTQSYVEQECKNLADQLFKLGL